MIKNEFWNCFLVNLTWGHFGDTHRALNCAIIGFWWMMFFPMTRDICIVKAYNEVKQ